MNFATFVRIKKNSYCTASLHSNKFFLLGLDRNTFYNFIESFFQVSK